MSLQQFVNIPSVGEDRFKEEEVRKYALEYIARHAQQDGVLHTEMFQGQDANDIASRLAAMGMFLLCQFACLMLYEKALVHEASLVEN
jgi:hypothetical protein